MVGEGNGKGERERVVEMRMVEVRMVGEGNGKGEREKATALMLGLFFVFRSRHRQCRRDAPIRSLLNRRRHSPHSRLHGWNSLMEGRVHDDVGNGDCPLPHPAKNPASGPDRSPHPPAALPLLLRTNVEWA